MVSIEAAYLAPRTVVFTIVSASIAVLAHRKGNGFERQTEKDDKEDKFHVGKAGIGQGVMEKVWKDKRRWKGLYIFHSEPRISV